MKSTLILFFQLKLEAIDALDKAIQIIKINLKFSIPFTIP
jgi:hypothetical protein